MAEAIELNFPNENDKSSKELNTLVEDTARELAKEIDKKTTKDDFSKYQIDNYYNDLNSRAFPLGSLIKSVACSPGLPLNLM